MTSVATTQIGSDGVREFADAADAAAYVADGCLADQPVGQVGLEIEAHCFDLAAPACRPSWERIGAVIAELPALPGHSRVTVEPGGAVELSGPPATGPLAAIAAMSADRTVLTEAFLRAGLGLVLLGADPLRAPRRVNPGDRYVAMERFFAAAGTGAAGAAMMTSTASIQLNLDAGHREGWPTRVALAHALGPTMIAMTANSPLLAGEFTGWVSSRQQVWSRLDTARCGPILGADGLDPAADWGRYALKAPVMLVHTPQAVPVTTRVPFADWADGLVRLGDRRPTTADLDYHLTTLFPPVRPRGWLEIRYLDALPDALWPAVVFTLTTLLDHPRSAAEAAAVVAPVATAWDTAARLGLRDRRLRTAARRCVEIAAAVAPPELAAAMAQLAAGIAAGRCPGDHFAEVAIRSGIESAVIQLVQGDS